MKKNQPKERPKPYNLWWCETCQYPANSADGMDHQTMLSHLKTAHNIDPKGKTCHRRLIMHMDGAEWFSYQWSITVEGITLTNSTLSLRSPESAMLHA
jgi:hypothetical protein